MDTATDVAKDAADVVLLEKDLGVLAAGVAEGRWSPRITFVHPARLLDSEEMEDCNEVWFRLPRLSDPAVATR